MVDEEARVLDAVEASLLVHEPAPAHHDMSALRRVDLGGDPVERARQEGVVGVEEREDVSRREREALVDGVALPAVRLADDLQMGIVLQDLRRVVRGHSVDDDVLDVGVALGEDALDRVPYETRLIEGRRHDGDAGRLHAEPARFRRIAS